MLEIVSPLPGGGKRFKTGTFNLVPAALIKFVGFSVPFDLNLTAELSKNSTLVYLGEIQML